ncbi:MAG TPA: hypothetical protein VH680_13085 [Gemmatimonadales bacterium]|jgi:hypothetical protein
MRRLALCCCAVLLASCSKSKEQPAEDAMADAGAAAPAAAPIALSDVAGKWNVRLMAETGDSTLRTYQMVATADTMGWEIHFPDRPPVPVRVLAVNGDSIVTEAGPFESVVRKGIQVTSRSVNRLQDGKLVSVITAHYQAKGPDSVSTFRSEATRGE